MDISFLVTFYNQEKYVKQCLDSIINIEKPNEWEILIGDDGSTDGTIDVVQEYINDYPENIKLFHMDRECGKVYDSVKRASENRLNLLRNMKGDYYCIVDGDDFYYNSSFVKLAIDIMNIYKTVSVVAFGYALFYDGILKKAVSLKSISNNGFVKRKKYLTKGYIPSGACVFKRCFDLDRIDYIKSLGFFDDNNIVINGLNYGEMYTIDENVYAYRQTGVSLYTKMNHLEKSILNIQGLDVDIRLATDEMRPLLLERYSSSFITLYIWKNRVQNILGNNIIGKYKEGCSNLKPSYCIDLIDYNSLVDNQKKEIRKIFISLVGKNKKFYVKEIIRFLVSKFVDYE